MLAPCPLGDRGVQDRWEKVPVYDKTGMPVTSLAMAGSEKENYSVTSPADCITENGPRDHHGQAADTRVAVHNPGMFLPKTTKVDPKAPQKRLQQAIQDKGLVRPPLKRSSFVLPRRKKRSAKKPHPLMLMAPPRGA